MFHLREPGQQTGHGIVRDGRGNLTLLSYDDRGNGTRFAVISQLDVTGRVAWQHRFPDPSNDTSTFFGHPGELHASQAGVIWACTAHQPIDVGSGPLRGGILAQLNADGTWGWSRVLGDYVFYASVSAEGSIAATGLAPLNGARVPFVTQLASDGATRWMRLFPRLGDVQLWPSSVATDGEEVIVLAGIRGRYALDGVVVGDTGNAAVLLRLNADGSLKWAKTLPGVVLLGEVRVGTDGTIFVGGTFGGSINWAGSVVESRSYDPVLLGMDASGAELFLRTEPLMNTRTAIATPASGGVAFLADASGGTDPVARVWRTDSQGAVLWQRDLPQSNACSTGFSPAFWDIADGGRGELLLTGFFGCGGALDVAVAPQGLDAVILGIEDVPPHP